MTKRVKDFIFHLLFLLLVFLTAWLVCAALDWLFCAHPVLLAIAAIAALFTTVYYLGGK